MKTGIIGCGTISDIYAEAGRKFPVLEVVACADLRRESAASLASRHGIPAVMEVDELLADPEIGLVINLTIPAAHGEIALKALRKGKHVYSEKPLAMRRRDARELIGLAREKNLRVGCAPDTFLGAGLQTCRELIDSGAIGSPIGATAAMLCRGHESWHPNPAFFYKKGAGPLFDMGPYHLTALVSLLGPVSRVAGSARISFPRRTVASQPRAGEIIDVEIPTHVAAVLDFASGPVATLTTSFDVSAHNLPNIEIYGEEGTLLVPDPNSFGGPVRIRKRGSSDWEEVPLARPYDANSRGLGAADMAMAIALGTEHRANERLAYHVLDTMHSIIDSSEDSRHLEVRSACTRPLALPPEGLPMAGAESGSPKAC
ncbi:MAG: Gfo/Idh/MocA family oxidoreductase [Terrimicrobiaceae bacterium]